jgi:hypothetical protein
MASAPMYADQRGAGPTMPPAPQQQHPQGGYQPGPSRPRMHVRSTFMTTEFWVFVVLSVLILIASAIVDDGDGRGFGAQDAWRYITWLGIGYMLSRGLAKLSNGRRED